MPAVDHVHALAVAGGASAGVGENMRAAEPGFDAVVMDVDAQAVADETRGSGS